MALLLGTGCPGAPLVLSPERGPRVDLAPFRASAVPLFVQTPYLHTWLCGDRLADEAPKLWNGEIKGMVGMLKIDGKTYRFLGMPGSTLPALHQDSVRILPTSTAFEFSQDGVHLALEFLSPLDPRDLRLLSLPVGLLRAEVRADSPRAVQLYFDITGEWAVGSSERRITWDGLFRIRPSEPRLFHETHNYPDWGEVHWIPVNPATSQYGIHLDVRQAFMIGGSPRRDSRYPRAANDDWPVFAHWWDLGQVTTPVVRRAILGHLRREVVDFYGTSCPALWTRYYRTGGDLMAAVASDFEAIRLRAQSVDREVLSRAWSMGKMPLASLAALTFRQSFAASELALWEDQIFYFSKSMDISGVSAIQSLEVLYPASSALLAFNPALLGMQLAPIFEALRRGDWREPHAMGDLGAYPVASGQLSPAAASPRSTAELILLARMAGVTDRGSQIAELTKALSEAEPEIRSLLALGGGTDARSQKLLAATHEQIRSDAFVDRLLGTAVFHPDAVAREVKEVQEELGRYGAPFESRRRVVHVDALLWIAALADPPVREALAAAAFRAYTETSTRVPAPDRYESETARSAGTQARPVVGAVFAPLLLEGPAGGR